MSKFFKALEQAELDRALREQAVARPGHSADADAGRGGGRPAEAVPASTFPDALPEGVDEHLVSLLAPASFEVEHYRALAHLVEQLHRTANLAVLAVSSPANGDGKTTTAINLAGALCQAPDARVLLIDADLRQSSLAGFLGLGDAGPGLAGAILDANLALDDIVHFLADFNLSVLPAGRFVSNSYELLRSPRLGNLIAEARPRYDFIVVDTPPLVHVPDCRVIGRWMDGFLVVVNAHKTPRKLVEEALNVIDPAKVAGLVFNGDDGLLTGHARAYRRVAGRRVSRRTR